LIKTQNDDSNTKQCKIPYRANYQKYSATRFLNMMKLSQPTCQICHSTNMNNLLVKEQMYGTNEAFNYKLCDECGCLQLPDPPDNLEAYYPKNYYSFNPTKNTKWKLFRRGIKRRIILNHPKIISSLIKVWLNKYPLFWIYRKLGVNQNSKVLDVGAGNGSHVIELHSAGVFKSLGVDLFVNQDISNSNTLLVKKGTLIDLEDRYDLIMFHHSFEHMPNQLETLQQAKKLLRPNGIILIRIPTVTSEAFKIYKENWFQLDAPRHLFLHSHKSIKKLSKDAGLVLTDLWCDSSFEQFAFSQQYQQGISLNSPISYSLNKKNSIFSKSKINDFKKKSILANRNNLGDQICVILKLPN